MQLNNNWVVTVIVALGGTAVLGMAGAWWVNQEVQEQLAAAAIPDTTQLTTDVAVIKGDIANINANVALSLEAQQRFEEIFMEYLQSEANR